MASIAWNGLMNQSTVYAETQQRHLHELWRTRIGLCEANRYPTGIRTETSPIQVKRKITCWVPRIRFPVRGMYDGLQCAVHSPRDRPPGTLLATSSDSLTQPALWQVPLW